MKRKAVTNSTCLIGLERIGRLDLLPQVFEVIFAPPTVAIEVQGKLTWLTVQAVQNQSVIATYSGSQIDEVRK